MTLPILSTKLFIPPLRSDLLPRSQIIQKLEESTTFPVALISASAGYGKTTVVSEWVSKSKRPVAWVSLDSGDNDPVQFLSYLISAIQTIHAGFGEKILEMLDLSHNESLEIILINLINEITEIPNPFSLIFDDYHVITDPKTNDLVVSLIDRKPPQMHLVVLSRIDPLWNLARYRARNQIYEIRGKDLRFSENETREFLNHSMGLNLTEEGVKALNARTEGWIAGLQLAALSMQGSRSIPEFIQEFTGSHLYVAEYLVEEILKQQPDEIQDFLLQTSNLERLNSDLCEKVSGCSNGQEILSTLHRENAFLIPLDDKGIWYRYHHLFADLLQARSKQKYSPEQIASLHLLAADWFEENGYINEAVNHAFKAANYQKAADLVMAGARQQIFSGRINILRKWLENFPENYYQTYPPLRFLLFWIDVLQTRTDLSDRTIQEIEDLLNSLPSTQENDRLRGEFAAVVCRAVALSGQTEKGIRLAEEALTYLPEDNISSRARANSALAIAHDLEGRPQKAQPGYEKAIDQSIRAKDFRLAAHTLMAKGLIQSHYGELKEAANTFQKIIDMREHADNALVSDSDGSILKTTKNNKEFFPAGQGYIGLGSVYLEWNKLEEAENYLKQGLDLCKRGGIDGIFIGKIQMSRLHQAKGDLDEARKEIQMEEQAQRADLFNLATRQIQIGLAQNDKEHISTWAAPFMGMLDRQSEPGSMPLIFFEILEANIARVHIAEGDLDKALKVLKNLQETAGPANRVGRLIEIHMLKALASLKRNGGKIDSAAVESMIQALNLGLLHGYFLLFLEEGLNLIPLLRAVEEDRSTSVEMKDYIRKLLEGFQVLNEHLTLQPQIEGLIEQLTPREIEVLKMIADGDSNQEIADQLFITVRTVKKHTSNIYGKLGVSSRTQAVAYAREIGLLPLD